ncbi:MAG: YciI family protein [Acidimicrobiales bacterium]
MRFLKGLSTPELAKSVVWDGARPPVATDGPFPESQGPLVGYRLAEVATAARTIEIAAKISAAPGAGEKAIRQPIEVRRVKEAPDPESLADRVSGEE